MIDELDVLFFNLGDDVDKMSSGGFAYIRNIRVISRDRIIFSTTGKSIC